MRYLGWLLLVAVPAQAQELSPSVSPRPEARPAIEERVSAEPALEDRDVDMVEVETEPGQRDLLRLPDADYAACLSELDALQVSYVELDPIRPEDDRDCGIIQPIEVTEIAPGVALEPAATLRCPTAAALGRWTRDFVLPASARLQDYGALTAIENGSAYICRPRVGGASGKLSEHAFGNGVDVMAFGFEADRRIAVQPREGDGTAAEAFQDAVRATACLEFSTVLGPGSNAAHDDHLHLDIKARSTGWRLCEQGGITPGD